MFRSLTSAELTYTPKFSIRIQRFLLAQLKKSFKLKLSTTVLLYLASTEAPAAPVLEPGSHKGGSEENQA